MPDGIESDEEAARDAMDARDLANREEMDEMKKVMKGLERQLAEAASGSAKSGTQGAGTGPATGEQRGTAGAVSLQGLGARTGMYTAFTQTHPPKSDGNKDSWPTLSLTFSAYLRPKRCFDALSETAERVVLDNDGGDLRWKHSHERK